MNTLDAPARLLLVPTPLDFGCAVQTPLEHVLPPASLQAAAQTTHWICENAKSARAFLKRVDALIPLACPLQAQLIQELPHAVHKKGDHTTGFDAKPMLQAALEGHDIGLLCEAGMPAVADPGSSVVRAAHAMGLEVAPLAGPSAIVLALAASGLSGQNFAFVGYLPQAQSEREARIRQLEQWANKTGQTQIWIETPYRNMAMFKSLLDQLQASTYLSVAVGLTLADMCIQSSSVRQWKQTAQHESRFLHVLAQYPAVFALGR